MQKRILIKHKDLVLVAVGTYQPFEKMTADHPGFPEDFEVEDVLLGEQSVLNLLDRLVGDFAGARVYNGILDRIEELALEAIHDTGTPDMADFAKRSLGIF